MGIFDKIKNAIWGTDDEASLSQADANLRTNQATASASTAATPRRAPTPSSAPASGTVSTAAPQSAPRSAPSSTAPVDVAAMLDEAVRKRGQKLDWRHSIVDLMKALEMDSSLANRKELAKELNYSGDMNDSAAMNMWLHKALMKKLADHGGRVPPELLD
jgi:hypothetical protein